MVTSLPSFSLSLSLYLSLSLSPKVPHAQYRKRFRASYNRKRFRASYNIANDESPSQHISVGLAKARPNYYSLLHHTLYCTTLAKRRLLRRVRVKNRGGGGGGGECSCVRACVHFHFISFHCIYFTRIAEK